MIEYESQFYSIPELHALDDLLVQMYRMTMSILVNGEDSYKDHFSWGKRLHKVVKQAVEVSNLPLDIVRDDLWQQIHLIWLQSWKAFDGSRPLDNYLIDRTIWGLRDWLLKQSKVVRTYDYYLEEKPEFLLDLGFLLHGTKVYPLSVLTPYERYLVFLRYREEKSMRGIAKTVCKHHSTVICELRQILDKLRRLSNEEEDSSRPCLRGDGTPTASRDYDKVSSARNEDTTPEVCQRDCRGTS